MLYSYSPKNLTITWNGIDLSHGWAEDTFLEIEPLEARKGTTFGADGQMCVSLSPNKGAKITLTLQQTSTANKKIAAINAVEALLSAVSEDIAISAFTVYDASGNLASFVAWNAVLTEQPTNTFGNSVGEKTWTWICETMIETDDPASLVADVTAIVDSEVGFF